MWIVGRFKPQKYVKEKKFYGLEFLKSIFCFCSFFKKMFPSCDKIYFFVKTSFLLVSNDNCSVYNCLSFSNLTVFENLFCFSIVSNIGLFCFQTFDCFEIILTTLELLLGVQQIIGVPSTLPVKDEIGVTPRSSSPSSSFPSPETWAGSLRSISAVNSSANPFSSSVWSRSMAIIEVRLGALLLEIFSLNSMLRLKIYFDAEKLRIR